MTGCVAGALSLIWTQWGRGRSPGPRMAAVGARLVPLAAYSRRGGVAVPLSPEWPPWGRGRARGSCMAAGGRGRSLGPCITTLGAWPFT